MNQRSLKIALLLNGLLLMLAAFPAFAQIENENGIYFNKGPLNEFAGSVLKRSEKQNFDPVSHFSVEMRGRLDADGRLDKSATKFEKSEGDENVAAMTKEGILALSDAGVFGYLAKQDVKELKIKVSHDSTNFQFVITADRDTPELAKQSGMRLANLIVVGRIRSDGDYKVIFNSLTTGSEGKKFTVNLKMSTQTFQELVKKNLIKKSGQETERPAKGQIDSTKM
jgi:hypothetical protein